jgi:hypothetical protein
MRYTLSQTVQLSSRPKPSQFQGEGRACPVLDTGWGCYTGCNHNCETVYYNGLQTCVWKKIAERMVETWKKRKLCRQCITGF